MQFKGQTYEIFGPHFFSSNNPGSRIKGLNYFLKWLQFWRLYVWLRAMRQSAESPLIRTTVQCTMKHEVVPLAVESTRCVRKVGAFSKIRQCKSWGNITCFLVKIWPKLCNRLCKQLFYSSKVFERLCNIFPLAPKGTVSQTFRSPFFIINHTWITD
jgi:hypothetical protein